MIIEHNHDAIDQAISNICHPQDIRRSFHLFVYGDLKQGHMSYERHGLKKYGRLIKEYEINNHILMLNESYLPIMLMSDDSDDIVKGEIYSIGDRFKIELDRHHPTLAFIEISPGIYAYTLEHPEIAYTKCSSLPKNKWGKYEWSKAMELSVVMHHPAELIKRKGRQNEQVN